MFNHQLYLGYILHTNFILLFYLQSYFDSLLNFSTFVECLFMLGTMHDARDTERNTIDTALASWNLQYFGGKEMLIKYSCK